MPRDGSGVFSAPAGTLATPNTTILSANYNAFVNDLVSDANAARPVTAGGTGGDTAVEGHDGLVTKGADIASAATLNLNNATGAFIDITGTTAVTAVTLTEGRQRKARAVSAFTLSASASLIVNGSTSVSYTTTAGDLLFFEGYSSSVVRVWTLSGGSDAFPTGHLYGFALTAAADANNDFTMGSGTARSASDDTNIIYSGGLTKQIDATWASGNNAGGRFHASLTAGSKIYAYVIYDPANNLVDWGYSDNASDPTGGASYPAAYTQYARVDSFWRSSGSVNLAPRQYSVEVTEWVAYTPTFTNFGTATSVNVKSRRVGGSLEISGTFTTGVGSASEVRVSLGSNGGNSNVIPDTTLVTATQVAGLWARAGTAGIYVTLASAGNSYMTIANPGGGGMLTATGGGSFNGSEAQSFTFSCPIAGW